KERPDQARLLSPPPAEPHLVRETWVLGEAPQDLQQRRSTATVIVDPRSGLHAIEMRAQEDDVVRVSLLGLGEHVPRLALLEDGVDKQRDLELLAVGDAGLPPLSHLPRDHGGWDDVEPVLGAKGGALVGGARLMVIEDD